MTPRTRAAVATLAAGAAAAVARRALSGLPRTMKQGWERTNHAGRTVTLLEGPAWVLGAAGGVAVAPATRPAAMLVTIASGALGALDDLAGSAASKGLKGHLGALARGEITTGAVKIVGLAAAGLVGALLADHGGATSAAGRPRAGLAASLVGGAVIAGAANAANLFDLRPGRALKVVLVSAAPLALLGSAPAGAAMGASAALIGEDLAGTAMLGDSGANAAGALVGLAIVEHTGLRGRLIVLAGLTALTLASERVSFTAVIEGNDVLRRLDEWGRARP